MIYVIYLFEKYLNLGAFIIVRLATQMQSFVDITWGLILHSYWLREHLASFQNEAEGQLMLWQWTS